MRKSLEGQKKESPVIKSHLEILAQSSSNKRSLSTDRRLTSQHEGSNNGGSSLAPDHTNAETASSTTSLLRQDNIDADHGATGVGHGVNSTSKGILAKVTKSKSERPDVDEALVSVEGTTTPPPERSHIRFDISQEGTRAALLLRARMGHSQLRQGVNSVLRKGLIDGAIIKMEKMLVRIDATNMVKIPDEYDENSSQGVVSATRKKWREYMIVVRQNKTNDVSDFILQAYKTRVSLQEIVLHDQSTDYKC